MVSGVAPLLLQLDPMMSPGQVGLGAVCSVMARSVTASGMPAIRLVDAVPPWPGSWEAMRLLAL